MFYTLIKHRFLTYVLSEYILSEYLQNIKRRVLNAENTSCRRVFSTFPTCSQMPLVFYHSVIHDLDFFICYKSMRAL